MRSNSSSLVAAVSAAFVVACASVDLGSLFAPSRACDASSEQVDAYLRRVTALASRELRADMLARNEVVLISFALDADGAVSVAEVVRARRTMTGREALRAVRAAAPFPPPPFDPKACLVDGRAQLSLISYGRCDRALAERYVEAVAHRVQDAIGAADLRAPEPERVGLAVKIDASGAARSIRVQTAASAEAGEQVAALARSVSPFAAPDESIRECIVEHAFFVWVELPRAD